MQREAAKKRYEADPAEYRRRQREKNKRWRDNNQDRAREKGRLESQKYRTENEENYRAAQRRYGLSDKGKAAKKRWYDAIKDFVANYKMKHGCKYCGYKEHPAALDFHHVGNDKTKSIARMRSMKAILAEVGKCEVVCANCHRIITAEGISDNR